MNIYDKFEMFTTFRFSVRTPYVTDRLQICKT